MRVLMVLDREFPPDTRVENEIDVLSDNNHEVHLACFTMKNRPAKETLKSNVIIHRKSISKFIHKTSVGALKFPIYFNFWRRFLRKILNENHFDAIHIHDLPLAKVGKELSIEYNLKFVLDLHENWPSLLEVSSHVNTFLGRLLSNQNQWRKYEVESCKSADSVIVVVEEAKNRFEKLGIDGGKIRIVSNTLNFNHFSFPDENPDDDFITALYSGGINEHRGLQYVIKGIKYLNGLKKPVRIYILGTGSYVDNLKELAQKEGVEEKVLFLGWKPFNEMQKYYGKANIFLIPHRKSAHTDSTIPHKLFQYIYCKRPVLATNCEPIERIVNETKSGLIYNFDDPKDFATKFKMLTESEPSNTLDFEFAYEQIIKKYNWEMDGKQLLKIYS